MNTTPVSEPITEPITEPVSKPTRSQLAPVIFLALVVWLMLVAGGYYVGKVYIDRSIDRSIEAIQHNNAVHMITIEQRIDSLDYQISEIKQAVIDTDETLASSGSTQENLIEKIEDLNEQLQDLERSLNTLKEAP